MVYLLGRLSNRNFLFCQNDLSLYGKKTIVIIACCHYDTNMTNLLFYISIRHYQRLIFFVLFCFSIIITGCSEDPTGSSGDDWTIKSYSYDVINSFPHDPAAFTQGLVFVNDTLHEGTGRYGQSGIRINVM